jgi:hypothetical protein
VTAAGAVPEPDTTIDGLANAGPQLDGQEVSFVGEVIGDIINAEKGHCWLTLVDNNSTISVFVSAKDAALVSHLGRYGQRGTTLLVQGVFEQDCAEHDGLTDVHASAVFVVDPGAYLTTDFNVRELQFGGLLILVALCLGMLYWYLRERSR